MREYSAIEANEANEAILRMIEKLANDKVDYFVTDTIHSVRNCKFNSKFFTRLSELDNSLENYRLVKREDYSKKYYHGIKLAISMLEYARFVNSEVRPSTEEVDFMGLLREELTSPLHVEWAFESNMQHEYINILEMIEDFLADEKDLKSLLICSYYFLVDLIGVKDFLGNITIEDGEIRSI